MLVKIERDRLGVAFMSFFCAQPVLPSSVASKIAEEWRPRAWYSASMIEARGDTREDVEKEEKHVMRTFFAVSLV